MVSVHIVRGVSRYNTKYVTLIIQNVKGWGENRISVRWLIRGEKDGWQIDKRRQWDNSYM
jgi:hypothetical protein